MSTRTHYQVLQVDREASADAIEVAYRRLARTWHPDINFAPDATARMQEINAAFQVLRDPVKRRTYDQQLTANTTSARTNQNAYGAAQPASEASFQNAGFSAVNIPVHCQECGKSDSSLRIAAFPYVVSVILLTFRSGSSGLYCGECRRKKMASAKLITLLLGWWGIPFGPIYSLGVLFENGGGKLPADLNADYLGMLGAYFLDARRVGEATTALKASLEFRRNQAVVELLQYAQSDAFSGAFSRAQSASTGHEWAGPDDTETAPLNQGDRKAADGIGSWGIIAALAIVALFLWVRQQGVPTGMPAAARSGTESVATTAAAFVPIPAEVGRTARIRTIPEADGAVIGTVEAGSIVEIEAGAKGCEWLRIRRGADEGWVNTALARIGIGDHCASLPAGVWQPDSSVVLMPAVEGDGELTVRNSGILDSIVILSTLENKPVVAVYVEGMDTLTFGGIPDGEYRVYHAKGTGWNGKGFSVVMAQTRALEDLLFETTDKQYTSWWVDVNPSRDGNTIVLPVYGSDFPELE